MSRAGDYPADREKSGPSILFAMVNTREFLTQWTGLYFFNGSFHTCCVTAGHPLLKSAIRTWWKREVCEAGLTLAPRTFTS